MRCCNELPLSETRMVQTDLSIVCFQQLFFHYSEGKSQTDIYMPQLLPPNKCNNNKTKCKPSTLWSSASQQFLWHAPPKQGKPLCAHNKEINLP